MYYTNLLRVTRILQYNKHCHTRCTNALRVTRMPRHNEHCHTRCTNVLRVNKLKLELRKKIRNNQVLHFCVIVSLCHSHLSPGKIGERHLCVTINSRVRGHLTFPGMSGKWYDWALHYHANSLFLNGYNFCYFSVGIMRWDNVNCFEKNMVWVCMSFVEIVLFRFSFQILNSTAACLELEPGRPHWLLQSASSTVIVTKNLRKMFTGEELS